jgi:Carboxypeptidase regulatory-like domain
MRKLVILWWAAAIAFACDCVYVPTCQRVNQTAVIFVGSVILEADHDYMTHFRVEEAFKGVEPGTREVRVGNDLICGGGSFQEGREYLVLANPLEPGGNLITGGCSGSAPVESASEDISFFRAWARGERVTVIQGRIAENVEEGLVRYRLDAEKQAGLQGVRLRAAKEGKEFSSFSGSDGRYRIPVSEPGTYALTALLPGHASTEAEYRIEVQPRSCAQQDIGMWTASRISGRVFDPDGKPMEGMPVSIEYASESASASSRVLPSETDANGKFEFQKVPPGDYVLGVNLSGLNSELPYSPRFYPGVSQRGLAQIIKIEGPQTIEGLDFSLEERRQTRTIAVDVVWPDGKPVTNADITCKSSRSDDSRFVADSVFRYTDQKGRAVCEVLADRDFQIEADRLSWTASSRPIQPIKSRPKMLVKAGSDPVRINIVVDKINDISDQEAPEDMSRFNGAKWR